MATIFPDPAFAKKIIALAIIFLSVSPDVLSNDRQGFIANGRIKVEHDDNVLRTSESTADSSVNISPIIKYSNKFEKYTFQTEYKGDYVTFADYTDFNFANHTFSAFSNIDYSSKMGMQINLSHASKSEEPGLSNAITIDDSSFNKNNKTSANIVLKYGKRESIGQIIFEMEHYAERYTNNGQEYRDADVSTLNTTFFYRITSKSRVLLQTRVSDYKYKTQIGLADRSSENVFVLTGVEWNATAKTSGTLKFGYQSKSFDGDTFNDFSGLSYSLDLNWEPNTYSMITVGASRRTRESTEIDTNSFVSNSYSIDFKHSTSARTFLKAGYSYDRQADIDSNRVDIRNQLSFGVDYIMLNWLTASLKYQYLERKSEIELFNYKSNTIGLSFLTTF